MKLQLSVLLPSFVVCLFVGCASPISSPKTKAVVTTIQPGNTYTYMNISRNASGVVTSTDTSVWKILLTNYYFHGDSNVILMEETSMNGQRDTGYFHFNASGDLEFFLTTLGGNNWVSMPFVSQLSYHTSHDSTLATGERDSLAHSQTFVRTENVTVNTVALTTSVILWKIAYSTVLNGSSSLSYLNTELSFAPDIHWVTHFKEILNTSDGVTGPLRESVLIGYTLN
jgi:hypothetical protein